MGQFKIGKIDTRVHITPEYQKIIEQYKESQERIKNRGKNI